MNCEKCLENLSAYIDHALASSEVDAVARHLDECPLCQEAYMQLVQILTMVGDMEANVPDGFHEALMNRITEEKHAALTTKHAGKIMRMQPRRWIYWASGAAAALLVAMSWMLQPKDAGQILVPVATNQQKSRGVPMQVADEAAPMLAEAAPMAEIVSEEWTVSCDDVAELITALENQGYVLWQTVMPEQTQIMIDEVTDKQELEDLLQTLGVTIQEKKTSDQQSVLLFIKK